MRKYLVCLLLPFDFLLIPLIALLAVFGRYPRWFVTPDDPTSPFGLYEPAVRRAYYGTDQLRFIFRDGRAVVVDLEGSPLLPGLFRRWWGDFYWLGLRNRMYGFVYSCKPKRLMPAVEGNMDAYHPYKHAAPGTYEHIRRSSVAGEIVTVFEAGGYRMWKVFLGNVAGHPFGIMFGYKVDSIVLDPHTPRNPINMEARPICSIRRLD